jgi:hypothetical protein
MLKWIAVTILVPIAIVAVVCIASSFHLLPYGGWRIGPMTGYSWNGGARAHFGSVTIGYHSGNWLLERGFISDDGLISACSFVNIGPFFLTYCGPHIRSTDV